MAKPYKLSDCMAQISQCMIDIKCGYDITITSDGRYVIHAHADDLGWAARLTKKDDFSARENSAALTGLNMVEQLGAQK